MGRAQYKLRKHVGEEQAQIEKAGAKRGLWSKIGMGLGGLIAMGLTGGAATPFVAALMAGGGTLAGGFAGRQLAAKGKGGKIRGGKFFQDEREDLISTIDESIWAGAGKTALSAGMTSLGAGISYGKEGFKAAIPGKSITIGKGGVKTAGEGFKMGDIFKRGTETATYGEGLMGRLGKALDVKGSAIGQQRHIQNLWNKPDLMQFAEAQGPPLPSVAESSIVMKGDAPDITAFDDPGQYYRRDFLADSAVGPNIDLGSLRREDTSLLDGISKVSPSPQMRSMWSRQGLKTGVEDYFALGSVIEELDVLSYPSGGAQGPPQKFGREMGRHAGYGSQQPQWWNRLFGGE